MSNEIEMIPIKTISIKDYALPIATIRKKCTKLDQYLQKTNSKIDLSDPNALMAYNNCLFWVLEGLKVEIPEGHLIPTAGLRRAIASNIISEIKPKTAIEIGCGPSAIIALLLAKKNISVYATEIDPQSYNYAQRLIKTNMLEKKIIVYKSNGKILKWLEEEHLEIFPIDIAISLPPFYEKNSQKPNSLKGFRGTDFELYTFESAESFAINMLIEADKMYPKIKNVGLLWKNKESMVKGFNLIKNLELTTKAFELLGGTRKRYFTLTELK